MSEQPISAEEEDLKKFIRQISSICLSEEFQVLRKELEIMYLRCKLENAGIIAFQDALYSMLVQEEAGNRQTVQSGEPARQ